MECEPSERMLLMLLLMNPAVQKPDAHMDRMVVRTAVDTVALAHKKLKLFGHEYGKVEHSRQKACRNRERTFPALK